MGADSQARQGARTTVEAQALPSSEGVAERSPKRHLRPVLGEHDPDGQERSGAITIVAIAVALALMSAGATYVWQHGNVTDSESDVITVRRQLATSTSRVTGLEAEIDTLRDQLADAKGRLHTSSKRSGFLASRVQEVEGKLGDLRNNLRTARAEAAASQQQLVRTGGAPLADGTYRVRMIAAQVATAPPLVLVSQPFTDGEWRMLSVAPGADVSLVRPATRNRMKVPLGRFGKMLRRRELQRVDQDVVLRDRRGERTDRDDRREAVSGIAEMLLAEVHVLEVGR
jgi:hypothetical protein